MVLLENLFHAGVRASGAAWSPWGRGEDRETLSPGGQRTDGFYGDFGAKKAAKYYSCNRRQYLTTTMNIEYSKWMDG